MLHSVKASKDGTFKFLFDCSQGAASPLFVDTVLIPMLSGPQCVKRYTVCVSSQVGCAQNCQFCFTGRMGLLRQLSAAQIVEQLVAVRRYMLEQAITEDVGNVVFMGTCPSFMLLRGSRQTVNWTQTPRNLRQPIIPRACRARRATSQPCQRYCGSGHNVGECGLAHWGKEGMSTATARHRAAAQPTPNLVGCPAVSFGEIENGIENFCMIQLIRRSFFDQRGLW